MRFWVLFFLLKLVLFSSEGVNFLIFLVMFLTNETLLSLLMSLDSDVNTSFLDCINTINDEVQSNKTAFLGPIVILNG